MIEESKELQARKKEIYDEVNKINKVIEDCDAKKTKVEKKVHPKYNKADILAKGIMYSTSK